MHPLNTDRFRFPRLTNKERSFIEAEARRDEVRADFRTMVESAVIRRRCLPRCSAT